eukprot:6188070-Pleurochrysis_carterae.AAC.1
MTDSRKLTRAGFGEKAAKKLSDMSEMNANKRPADSESKQDENRETAEESNNQRARLGKRQDGCTEEAGWQRKDKSKQ